MKKLRGKEKSFWVQETRRLFDSGLCLPEKGDTGEIMAALYMLFCADELRFNGGERFSLLPSFAVDLGAWIDRLAAEKAKLQSDTGSYAMEINFIQVCRNYSRSRSWYDQRSLEFLYNSATAFYTYPYCPGFDICSAIRITHSKKKPEMQDLQGGQLDKFQNEQKFSNGAEDREEAKFSADDDSTNAALKGNVAKGSKSLDTALQTGPHFSPLLISVKNREDGKDANAKKIVNEAKELIESEREKHQSLPSVLYILLWLGAEKPGTNTIDLGSFPEEDCFLTIHIPQNDTYGISSAIQQMSAMSAGRELYSSHAFLAMEESTRAKNVLWSGCDSNMVNELSKYLETVSVFKDIGGTSGENMDAE